MQNPSIARRILYVFKTILFNQPIIQKFLRYKVAVVVVLYEVVLLSWLQIYKNMLPCNKAVFIFFQSFSWSYPEGALH
jgi:hypothetical protein